MVASYVTDLQKAVSSSRLESYRPINGSDFDMTVNYFWNLALAEALVPTLATLEVVLRNSIHTALTKREGTDMWFRNVLEPNQLRDYANAHMTLYRRQKRVPVAGQVVAELNFGFWTALLSQLYHQSIWVPDRAAMIRRVFPFSLQCQTHADIYTIAVTRFEHYVTESCIMNLY